MKKSICSISIQLILANALSAQIQCNGNPIGNDILLEDLIVCIKDNMSEEASDSFFLPTNSTQKTEWESVVEKMLTPVNTFTTQICPTIDLAMYSTLKDNYKYFSITDEFNKKDYCVLIETEDSYPSDLSLIHI